MEAFINAPGAGFLSNDLSAMPWVYLSGFDLSTALEAGSRPAFCTTLLLEAFANDPYR